VIDISKALRIIESQINPLPATNLPLEQAVGRVLREDIIADTDLPPFDRSQMDGYAVMTSDLKTIPVPLAIVGESAAGKGWHNTIKAGQAVRIMTGAPLPKGADAVQKIELTRESANGKVVEILEAPKLNQHIVRKGSEVKTGAKVFRAGEAITKNMIASLASFGYAKVKVTKTPRITIMGTGSEIVEIAKRPGRDQIRNSNSVMLAVLCRSLNADTTILPIVRDDIAKLKAAIKATAKASDILIMTGGVSVGKYDHTKTALLSSGPGSPLTRSG
jgi:molybdopterin biosynthesis enzyme